MPTLSEACAPAITGNLLHFSEGHEAAIYQRDGMWWVAEFRFGSATLTDASTWFTFHAGALRFCHRQRAAALESTRPIPSHIQREIARLQLQADAGDERARAVWAAVLRVLRRWGFGASPEAVGAEGHPARGQGVPS
jgi:hypothetical protein